MRPGGRDLRRAAECFEIASNLPDAPPQAARFAAYARLDAGDLYVSYQLWSHAYQMTTNPYVREVAEREMQRIAQALAEGRREVVTRHLGTPQVQVGGGK